MSTSDSDPLPRIRTHNAEARNWVVVLDDDPTGSQAVYDVTVLIDPSTEDLLRSARTLQPTFIWTNTRSLPEAHAVQINHTMVSAVLAAAATADVHPVFVSRGDSTLRGHFAAEISAVSNTLNAAGDPVDGVVFVPAFLEAGRFTADDVQWVDQPDGPAIPVTSTEFARDATFGYDEKNLCAWVAARTAQPVENIRSIALNDLRSADRGATEAVLTSLHDGAIAVANATRAGDLESLALACQRAQGRGHRLIYRTGPSFVRALIGQPARPPLTAADFADATVGDHGAFGLTVVASHTALTTRQLTTAVRRHDLTVIELDVTALLDEEGRPEARRKIIDALESALRFGHAALVTSRTARSVADDPHQSLAIARAISDEVCAIVAPLSHDVPLRYIIAKGGITSHEVAVRGLGMRRATVLGQLFAGMVSALRLGPETPRAGIPYVVFPGNVGTDDSLADVLSTLAGAASCS